MLWVDGILRTVHGATTVTTDKYPDPGKLKYDRKTSARPNDNRPNDNRPNDKRPNGNRPNDKRHSLCEEHPPCTCRGEDCQVSLRLLGAVQQHVAEIL